MVGHEHEGPQGEVECLTRVVDRVGQPQAGSLRFEKLEPAVATECEFVSVARLIESATPGLSLPVIHGGKRSQGEAEFQRQDGKQPTFLA